MDVADLLNRCLKKEPAAQRQFVEQYGKRIMVVCHRYATTTLEPSDIFQEAFIKIFAVLDQFDSEKGIIEAWIYRITVNVALKLIRKNIKYDQASEIADHVDNEDLRTELNDSLSYNELLGFINQLPDMQRLIFNMYAIEGFNHEEIAEQLGVTGSTSRSQYSRAKVKLKAMHEAYNNE